MSFAFVGVHSRVDPVVNATRAVAHFARTRELLQVSSFDYVRTRGSGAIAVVGAICVWPVVPEPIVFAAQLGDLERDLVHGAAAAAPPAVKLSLLAWRTRVDHTPRPCDFVHGCAFARALAELDPAILTRTGRTVAEAARAPAADVLRPARNLSLMLRTLAFLSP